MSLPANPNQTENQASPPTSHTNAETAAGISLTMRLPPFWRDRPKLWFISFEAATSDLKKGQAQLAQMVIAQLERQDIEQIIDILQDPPESGQYTAIKERLISAYEESDNRQFQKLLLEMELGEQKPTQLLRKMRNLARDKVPDSTLRLMWTNHLPSHVRSVLAVSESFSTKATLEDLALLADKMMEQTATVEVAAVQTPASSTPALQEDTQHLASELRKLSLEMAEMRAEQRRSRYPSRHRYKSRSRTRETQRQETSPVCYYHKKFKEQARRCTSPCAFKKPNAVN
ncbi:hypothetical protein PYW08_016531 [Mythimna loreyi]|uniref:Uncharacterized protein n=1 Tax=Mythimna loreyi TaxID=667449 RepID=A0ACC2R1J9_9NEOP|nr:hypothetical protein PYW08_016531 [Mythimna loreyi]